MKSFSSAGARSRTLPSALLMLAAAGSIAACAGSPALPAGKFVTFQCAENKSFQARMSDDGRTVRVRAHHGSAELDHQGQGRYAGEGYSLNLGAEGGVSLEHAGKNQARGCRAAA
jgi:hypothetical protein